MAGITACLMAISTPAYSAAVHGSTADLETTARIYLQSRVDRLAGVSRGVALDAVPATAQFQDALRADSAAIDVRREKLRSANGGHSRGQVTVSDTKISTSGKTATVQLTEHTTLFYARTTTGSPDAEEYQLRHTLTYNLVGSQWVLSHDTPDIHVGDLAPDTYPSKPEAVSEAARSSKKISGTSRPRTTSQGAVPDKSSPTYRAPGNSTLAYDYGAMTRYALQYWDNYNPNYRTYGGEGGDCTNFISQIVKAGGWAETGSWPGENRTLPDQWYYGHEGTWTTTYTWAAAENWYWFASPFNSGRTEALDNIWEMGVSDVLQIDFDRNDNISHSMFVTGRDGGGQIADELYMTYHSTNTRNKRLSSIIAATPDAWFYAHRT
ncbi:amidase domain-containing protein [Nonomuraea sp. ZG12]|uniref:amidase domain-containing protein n=1 Tax=Nonomuraea sp. ZG12 TaxID=3452207 RepID=UPI003F8AA5EA